MSLSDSSYMAPLPSSDQPTTARRIRRLLFSNPLVSIPLGVGPAVAIDVLADLNSLIHIPIVLAGIYFANLLLDWLRPSGKPAFSPAPHSSM